MHKIWTLLGLPVLRHAQTVSNTLTLTFELCKSLVWRFVGAICHQVWKSLSHSFISFGGFHSRALWTLMTLTWPSGVKTARLAMFATVTLCTAFELCSFTLNYHCTQDRRLQCLNIMSPRLGHIIVLVKCKYMQYNKELCNTCIYRTSWYSNASKSENANVNS